MTYFDISKISYVELTKLLVAYDHVSSRGLKSFLNTCLSNLEENKL